MGMMQDRSIVLIAVFGIVTAAPSSGQTIPTEHGSVVAETVAQGPGDVRQGPDGAIWILTDNSDGRVVPAKVDPPLASAFDVNDDWSAVQSTDVLVGSYPIETAGGGKFAWVGPTA